MKADLLQHVDQIPPALARFCGRIEGRPKTIREIISDSGLSYRKVKWISRQPTWSKVKIEDAVRFADACGLDLLRPRRKLFYLRRAVKPGDVGLRCLAGGLPLSYIVRQLNIIEEYEATRPKRERTNGARRKAATAN